MTQKEIKCRPVMQLKYSRIIDPLNARKISYIGGIVMKAVNGLVDGEGVILILCVMLQLMSCRSISAKL